MRNKIPILHIDIDIPAFECQFRLRAVQVQRSTFNGHGSLGQKIQIDQLEGHGHRAQKKRLPSQVNSNHDGLGGTTEKQVYISYCCNSSTATGNHSGYCINKLLAVKRIIIVRSPA